MKAASGLWLRCVKAKVAHSYALCLHGTVYSSRDIIPQCLQAEEGLFWHDLKRCRIAIARIVECKHLPEVSKMFEILAQQSREVKPTKLLNQTLCP